MPDSHTHDRAVFGPDAISDETRAFNAQLAQMMSGAKAIHEQTPAEVRDGGRAMPVPEKLDHAQVRTIEVDGHSVSVRLLVPERVDGVYLYVHGGGWVLGAADTQDVVHWETAQHANVAVVSVDYRLAPEFPYPAPNDDCEAAAAWLARNAQSEFGTDRLVIGGGSAGAHLAANALLRMRDRHAFTGFAAANLVFGVYDLSMTPSQRQGHDRMIIPTPTMQWFYRHYLQNGEDSRDPDVSPLYASLHDMPAALFSVGTLDPLLDDSLFMYERWRAAGNDAELAVFPGGVHGFSGQPTALGQRSRAQQNAFIAAAIAEPAGAARG